MQTDCWKSSPRLESKDNKNNDEELANSATINKEKVYVKLNSKNIEIQFTDSLKKIDYKTIFILRKTKSKVKLTAILKYIDKMSDDILCEKEVKICFKISSISEKIMRELSKIVKKTKRPNSFYFVIDERSEFCKLNEEDYGESCVKIAEYFGISVSIKYIRNMETLNEICEELKIDHSHDGLILFCGDEAISQLLSLLIQGTNPSNPTPFIKPIGIIPTGNNNDVAESIWGNLNATQIFYNILLGETIPADIMSLNCENMPTMWGFNIHYGYYTNQCFPQKISENISKTKPLKISKDKMITEEYDISYSSKLFERDNNVTEMSNCSSKCSLCRSTKLSITETPVYHMNGNNHSIVDDKADENNLNYKQGSYNWIILNSIPCKNNTAPFGFVPSCHFANDAMDIVLLKESSKKYLKNYLKQQKSLGNQLTLPFVESIRTEEISFISKLKKSWSKDLNDILTTDLSKCNNSNNNNNEIIIIQEDDLSSDSNEDDDDEDDEKDTQADDKNSPMKEEATPIRRLSTAEKFKKACKDFMETTEAPKKPNESYRKPILLETERKKLRAKERQEKQELKYQSRKAKWMIDYNVIVDPGIKVFIKNHSGLICFYCGYF